MNGFGPGTISGKCVGGLGGSGAEAYNHWDFLGLFSQLELLPREAFERALSGEKII